MSEKVVRLHATHGIERFQRKLENAPAECDAEKLALYKEKLLDEKTMFEKWKPLFDTLIDLKEEKTLAIGMQIREVIIAAVDAECVAPGHSGCLQPSAETQKLDKELVKLRRMCLVPLQRKANGEEEEEE